MNRRIQIHGCCIIALVFLIAVASGCRFVVYEAPPHTATGDHPGAAGDMGGGADGALSGDTAGADSSDGDSGDGGDVDCTLIGCAAPPVCGTGCTAPCGCCDCGAGGYCSGSTANNIAFNCDTSLGCYTADICLTGCLTDPASNVATCSNPTPSCTDVRDAYAALIAKNDCTLASNCQALWGQCGVGLGGCWEIVNQSVDQTDLDALGAQYSALSCTSLACSCVGPPTSLKCQSDECAPVW